MKKLLNVIAGLALFTVACASVPVRSTAAQQAYDATRVIQVLDLLRDAAIAANSSTPSLLSTTTTRNVVLFHETAITVIHAVPSGWKSAVVAGLDVLVKSFNSAEQKLLQPYVSIIQTVLQEIL